MQGPDEFSGEITRTVAAEIPAVTGPPAREAGEDLKSWKQFRILERVGAGAFGEVFRAFDSQLHREVALKLLYKRDDGTGTGFAETVREARAVARVRHANVVPVYGVDRFDSRIGFWSEFIRGHTLLDLVKTNGPLSEREAIQIEMDVCRALAAVHSAGLLHRDIKSSNVIRENGGRILLMDFGLSRDVGMGGEAAGTPVYMAPELFAGAGPSVATDIYAMGVMLYYLVTREYPVDGATWLELRKAHEEKTRRNLLDRRADLSVDFVRVVERALEPDPAGRFSSSGEMLAALGAVMGTNRERRNRYAWWVAGAAVIVALVMAVPMVRHSMSSSGVIPAEHYLAAQKILTRYDKPGYTEKAVEEFRKAAAEDPGSALAYAGLSRAYWLRYRATRDLQNRALALENCEKALQLDPQSGPSHVMMGRIQTNAGNTALATQELKRAQAVDGRNPDLWSALGELYEAEGRHVEAEAAVQQAVALSPGDWIYHNQLGVLEYNARKYADAVTQYKLVIDLARDNPQGWNNLGNALVEQGHLPEAENAIERSLAIVPRYSSYSNLGRVFFLMGRYRESSQEFDKALKLNGSSYQVWGNFGAALQWSNAPTERINAAYEHASSLAEKALQATPRDSSLLVCLGSYKIYLGLKKDGLPLIREAVALDPDNQTVLTIAAQACESAGLRDQALTYLGLAIQQGLTAKDIERSPEFSGLRQDSRYAALLSVKHKKGG